MIIHPLDKKMFVINGKKAWDTYGLLRRCLALYLPDQITEIHYEKRGSAPYTRASVEGIASVEGEGFNFAP
jgi:hypothetical protein